VLDLSGPPSCRLTLVLFFFGYTESDTERPTDPAGWLPHLKRVEVTPAVYPRLIEFLQSVKKTTLC